MVIRPVLPAPAVDEDIVNMNPIKTPPLPIQLRLKKPQKLFQVRLGFCIDEHICRGLLEIHQPIKGVPSRGPYGAVIGQGVSADALRNDIAVKPVANPACKLLPALHQSAKRPVNHPTTLSIMSFSVFRRNDSMFLSQAGRSHGAAGIAPVDCRPVINPYAFKVLYRSAVP